MTFFFYLISYIRFFCHLFAHNVILEIKKEHLKCFSQTLCVTYLVFSFSLENFFLLQLYSFSRLCVWRRILDQQSI